MLTFGNTGHHERKRDENEGGNVSNNDQIERALDRAVQRVQSSTCPPTLTAAVRHAVFPGGARVRPKLCLAVAQACAGETPAAAIASGCAIEFMHCASLAQDDMPCFDDAILRRGRPSVQAAYGAPLALLAGDALIVLALDTLASEVGEKPHQLAQLVSIVAASAGMPGGIVAGQAWECEKATILADYQRAKTGALFVAATMAGAVSAGANPEDWRSLGDRIGEAYQIADDIQDVIGNGATLGKPTGQDQAHGRPNAVAKYGFEGASERLQSLVRHAVTSIPDCAGADALRAIVLAESRRFVPKHIAVDAA